MFAERSESRRLYPTLGVTYYHRDGAPAFVFDMMEPERPRVDREVLDFVKTTVFDPATLRSEPTAFAGLIRKWRGWWWRGSRRKNSTAGIDVLRLLRVASANGASGQVSGRCL